jgi:hypothetical protein
VATFVLGTCLPDLSRVPAMLFTRLRYDAPWIPEWLCYAWGPLHVPVGIVLVSYGVALAFRDEERRWAFANLALGGLLHLAVDIFQFHFGMGYMLLFPLSTWDWELGWVGSEATVPVVPFLLPATILLARWRWRRRDGPPPSPLPPILDTSR